MPASKCSGVAGFDCTLKVMSAVPEHTPLIEIESAGCTLEKWIFPLLLMLSVFIKVPNRNKDAVIWPIPDLNIILTSAVVAAGEAIATNDDFVKLFGFLLVEFEEFGLALEFVFDITLIF